MTTMSSDAPFAHPPVLTPAGRRIAAAAAELFYDRGIRAVGVDTIAEVAGTTKKTIYDCFGSKDALIATYLVLRQRRWSEHLDAEIARHRSPGTRLLAVFDAEQSWLGDNPRGCAFVNAWAEAGTSERVAAVVRAEKAWMRSRIDALVAETGVPAADRVAATLHLLYEGALVTSTAGGDKHAVADARAAAARIMQQR